MALGPVTLVAVATAVVFGLGLVLMGPAFLTLAVQVWLIVAVLGFGAWVIYARFQTFSARIERGTGVRPSLAGGVLILTALTMAIVTF